MCGIKKMQYLPLKWETATSVIISTVILKNEHWSFKKQQQQNKKYIMVSLYFFFCNGYELNFIFNSIITKCFVFVVS